MTRPSADPTWATSGSADIVAPPTGKQELGWVGHEAVPAGIFNWLLNRIGTALAWLLSHAVSADEANTWTAKQSLNAGAEVAAGLKVASVGVDKKIEVVDGQIQFTGTTVSANPSPSAAVANTLCPANAIKLRARVHVVSGVVQGTDGVMSGFNVDHAGIAPGYAQLAVHFAAPMRDTDYEVQATLTEWYHIGSAPIFIWVRESAKHTGYFMVEIMDAGGTGLLWNDSNVTALMSFLVTGAQDT